MFSKLSGIVGTAPVPVVVDVVVGHGARSEPVEYDCDREGPAFGIAVRLLSEVVGIVLDVGVVGRCAVVGLVGDSVVVVVVGATSNASTLDACDSVHGSCC